MSCARRRENGAEDASGKSGSQTSDRRPRGNDIPAEGPEWGRANNQANLSSVDHGQASSNERPKRTRIKPVNDARLLCPS